MSFQERFNDVVMPAADRAFGITVVLSRTGRLSEEFTALWDKRLYQVPTAEGFRTLVEAREFTFDKAAAAFGATAVEPRAGDRLRVTENGTPAVYVIGPIGELAAVEEQPGGYRWLVRTTRET